MLRALFCFLRILLKRLFLSFRFCNITSFWVYEFSSLSIFCFLQDFFVFYLFACLFRPLLLMLKTFLKV